MCRRSGKSAHPVPARACPRCPAHLLTKSHEQGSMRQCNRTICRFRLKYTHRQQTRFPLWSVVSWQLAVTLLPTDYVDASRIPLCITTTHRCLLTCEGLLFFFTVKTVRLDGWDPPLLINVKGTESATQCCANTTHSKDIKCRYCSKKFCFYFLAILAEILPIYLGKHRNR